MKKGILFVVAVLAVAYPAAAGAGIFHGTVVAKQKSRHTLVLASATGHIRTVHTSKMGTHVGARLAVHTRSLSDGTFHATKLVHRGQARHARIHAVVVRNAHRRLLVSAGHSTFSIHTSRHISSLRRGDVVDAKVTVSNSGELEDDDVDEVAHEDEIELEGTLTALTAPTATDAGSLTVQVGGLSFDIAVPAGFDLPALNVGDRVEVEASVEGTTLTLTDIESEDEDDDGGGGGDD